MAPKTRWSEDDLTRAEDLYRTSTLSVSAIALECNMPRSTLHLRIAANGWRRRPDCPDHRTPGLDRAVLTRTVNAAERRRDLALRALAAAERQMAEIERRSRRGSVDVVEEERSARVLSATIRTLRELASLEARAAEAAKALGLAPEGEGRPDAPPGRGRAEVRRDFLQRVQALFGPGEVGARSDAPLPSGEVDGAAGG